MSTALWRTMRGALLALGLTAASVCAGQTDALAQGKTRLTVYTALDTDQLAAFKKAAEADVPNIDIVWVREGTGVVASRIIAERNNPRADLIWGLAVTSVIMLEERGLIEPYTPKDASELDPAFVDDKKPMAWTGMDAYLSVICFNTIEAAKKNIPAPKTWDDLLKPVYQNEIVMPNPASSGAGYLAVSAWLQKRGNDAGWAYLDALHKNIAVYTHSGSASCVQAARGERVVGIGFDMRAASEKTKGAPIDIIIPTDGIGWEMEATAIVKGTKNLDAAKALADWTVSKKANELYSKYFPIVARSDVKNLPKNYPQEARGAMIKNDLRWAATNNQAIIAEWTKRYDGKSAPK
ncbi:putative 2-aminoethylphosphonate ABC transporter substrate-binding protein [Reyranella sp. CPCC 100927]|uniref:putative 2-aminoethylphosphonate ABC transporter substrate-binding protein n=1 Tax=Reyranella sp. CPCC 100927 TaxID=2599616 RepID=UPI0021075FB2|nr:putative 2-aminoethylphosphonate ABC transporter substrate-binding protein [Reyranella sp. CPCC 100927]